MVSHDENHTGLEAAQQSPYDPLLDHGAPPSKPRRGLPLKALLLTLLGIVAAAVLVGINVGDEVDQRGQCRVFGPQVSPLMSTPLAPLSRGVSVGVSEKSVGLRSHVQKAVSPYAWSNDMLCWQRTAYHFQPEKNWMNDPNGPLFYKGWYHFFYQYNPYGAVWGNIVWGHAVSKDLVNWVHLPLAMVADKWYDINGVWTGSATILPTGELVMLYTGSTNMSVQVQNLAVPSDPSDPLLLRWDKFPDNPVLVPPPGCDVRDFRDPTTAWLTPDGKWRIAIGSKVGRTGISFLYDTLDFKKFEQVNSVLHGVPGTGMWECVDFYPVSTDAENGLDTSAQGQGVKHVLKVSLDDDRNDYYALGSYIHGNSTWVPDNEEIDVGIGLRYDYGRFYASKTFYDQNKKRRVLWGWIVETDSEFADVMKGWASLQSLPRTVVFDKKTGSNLIQWPVQEVESLRSRHVRFKNVKLAPGTVVPLKVHSASQLDIMAEFEVDKATLEGVAEFDEGYSCSAGGGAARRRALGPFGLLVLADKTLSEQSPVFFYIAKGPDGALKTFFCADETRSSRASDVDKVIYGSTVPVLDGEKLSIRILVDHSIVESFAQGGRTCITSRVYPTQAIFEAARLFLFNNATETTVTASVQVWQMKAAASSTYSPEMHTQL